MRDLSYAKTLVLACAAPWLVASANAADADTVNRANLSPSDHYFIDSRSGGDAGQEVDNYSGADVPSAESQMPADESHWQSMSGSSLPPPATPAASLSAKTPDWPSNPTGPLFK